MQYSDNKSEYIQLRDAPDLHIPSFIHQPTITLSDLHNYYLNATNNVAIASFDDFHSFFLNYIDQKLRGSLTLVAQHFHLLDVPNSPRTLQTACTNIFLEVYEAVCGKPTHNLYPFIDKKILFLVNTLLNFEQNYLLSIHEKLSKYLEVGLVPDDKKSSFETLFVELCSYGLDSKFYDFIVEYQECFRSRFNNHIGLDSDQLQNRQRVFVNTGDLFNLFTIPSLQNSLFVSEALEKLALSINTLLANTPEGNYRLMLCPKVYNQTHCLSQKKTDLADVIFSIAENLSCKMELVDKSQNIQKDGYLLSVTPNQQTLGAKALMKAFLPEQYIYFRLPESKLHFAISPATYEAWGGLTFSIRDGDPKILQESASLGKISVDLSSQGIIFIQAIQGIGFAKIEETFPNRGDLSRQLWSIVNGEKNIPLSSFREILGIFPQTPYDRALQSFHSLQDAEERKLLISFMHLFKKHLEEYVKEVKNQMGGCLATELTIIGLIYWAEKNNFNELKGIPAQQQTAYRQFQSRTEQESFLYSALYRKLGFDEPTSENGGYWTLDIRPLNDPNVLQAWLIKSLKNLKGTNIKADSAFQYITKYIFPAFDSFC
jgi:hypothetical protein